MSKLERAFRENRWTGIGAVAVIIGVVVAYASLRKQAAPVIITGASDTGTGTSDLSAFSAGASAASSGFDTGAALGQAGISLAGSVVTDFASVSSTLAASQAQVAASGTASLADAFASIVDWLQPDPGNPPPGAVAPPPIVPPAVPPAPAPAAAPATAYWAISITGATPVYASASTSSRKLGTVYSMSATATRSLVGGSWWYHITSARLYVGGWIRAGAPFTARAI